MKNDNTGLFITGIELLDISVNLGRGDCFNDIFFLTNDKQVIQNILPSFFITSAGSLETDSLLSGRPVIYSKEKSAFSTDEEAINHLNFRMAQVLYFLHLLWYEKDNASYPEMGYLITGIGDSISRVQRNFRGGPMSTAAGESNVVNFNREELRGPRHFFKQLIPPSKVTSQILFDQTSRWASADYFVQSARANSDLGVKISNYCSALEALFSTDSQELSHKLAERIAVFLEDDPIKRQAVYRDMKRAYNIRSQVVHGSPRSSNLPDQIKYASQTCDNFCRKALLKILTKKELHDRFLYRKKDEDFDEFFLKQIFNAPSGNAGA